MIVVVAAAVVHKGQVLLAQRLPGQHLAGTWEFPGGKVEPGETCARALARELAEEIASGIWPTGRELAWIEHVYPEKAVRIHLYRVDAPDWFPGQIPFDAATVGRMGQPLIWRQPQAIDAETMPPANAPLLAALCRDML